MYFKISLSNGTFFIMTLIILGCNFLKDCLVEFQSQMELNLQVQLQMGCNLHFYLAVFGYSQPDCCQAKYSGHKRRKTIETNTFKYLASLQLIQTVNITDSTKQHLGCKKYPQRRCKRYQPPKIQSHDHRKQKKI